MALASLKWTADSVVGLAVGALSIIGVLVTTGIHWGTANAQVAQVQQHQKEQDIKIDANVEALDELKMHDARVEQKLDDISASVEHIEKHEWHK